MNCCAHKKKERDDAQPENILQIIKLRSFSKVESTFVLFIVFPEKLNHHRSKSKILTNQWCRFCRILSARTALKASLLKMTNCWNISDKPAAGLFVSCDSIDLRFTLSAVVLYLHRF
jgi:hypothetical protein